MPALWLTIPEAIERTGIAERTLYRWAAQGRVESRVIEGHKYVDATAISAMRTERRANASKDQLKILIRDLYANAVLFNRMTDPLWRDLDKRVRKALGYGVQYRSGMANAAIAKATK
jgi:predicted site-specific integrase-resolvase